MNDYCYMHIMLLGFLTIASGIATVGMTIAYFNDTQTFAGVELRKRKWLWRSFVTLLLFSGGLSWWIHSGNQPLKPLISTFHEIKEVSYPDGTKVQMATVDGSHVNITSRFGKILDQEWVLHRVKYAKVYAGVSWSSSQDTWWDHYYLERKGSETIELERSNEDQRE